MIGIALSFHSNTFKLELIERKYGIGLRIVLGLLYLT
jgi:hypothetical protein